MFIVKETQKEKGVILLTVIMLTIILSIVAIGIMSVNVSQVKSSQSVVDSIKAEQLAIGAFYLCHQALSEGAVSNCPAVPDTDLDGKTFTITANRTAAAGTPNETDKISITVNYP